MKKVIVIDDSRIARSQIANALPRDEYDLIEAVDGIDGLAKIRAHTDACLIICDVNMPKMSGLELLAQVKEEQAMARVPFVLVTSEGDADVIRRAKRNGARCWFVKPVQPELLLAAVRKLLE